MPATESKGAQEAQSHLEHNVVFLENCHQLVTSRIRDFCDGRLPREILVPLEPGPIRPVSEHSPSGA
jgi:hypothetical protein